MSANLRIPSTVQNFWWSSVSSNCKTSSPWLPTSFSAKILSPVSVKVPIWIVLIWWHWFDASIIRNSPVSPRLIYAKFRDEILLLGLSMRDYPMYSPVLWVSLMFFDKFKEVMLLIPLFRMTFEIARAEISVKSFSCRLREPENLSLNRRAVASFSIYASVSFEPAEPSSLKS